MGLQAARTVYSVVVTPLARICSVREQWLRLGSTLTQDSRKRRHHNSLSVQCTAQIQNLVVCG
ncbi:Unannotated [Lentimonas sp. CC10]|nr:Unannotated [Lentimonas sp. CC10]